MRAWNVTGPTGHCLVLIQRRKWVAFSCLFIELVSLPSSSNCNESVQTSSMNSGLRKEVNNQYLHHIYILPAKISVYHSDEYNN